MATLYDLLAPDVRERFPRERLTGRANRLLDLEIPANVSPRARALVAADLAERMPTFTEPRLLPSHLQAGMPEEARRGMLDLALREEVARRDPVSRFLLRTGGAAVHALPSLAMERRPSPLGPPRTLVERAAELVGGIGGFVSVAAPVGAVAGGLGAGRLLAHGLGAGVAGGLAAGTPKERAVSAGVLATTAGAAAGAQRLIALRAGQSLSRANPRILAAATKQVKSTYREALRAGLGSAEARRSAQRAGVAYLERAGSRALRAQIPGGLLAAGAFGAAAPAAETAVLRATGEAVEMPPPSALIEGGAELAAFNLLMTLLSRGRVPAAARARAARKVTPEALRAVDENMRTPAPPTPEAGAAAGRAQASIQRVVQATLARPISLKVGERVIGRAVILDVKYVPWTRRGLRATVFDEATGEILPASFADLSDFRNAISARPGGRPVAGVAPERPVEAPRIAPEAEFAVIGAQRRVEALRREIAERPQAKGVRAKRRRLARLETELDRLVQGRRARELVGPVEGKPKPQPKEGPREAPAPRRREPVVVREEAPEPKSAPTPPPTPPAAERPAPAPTRPPGPAPAPAGVGVGARVVLPEIVTKNQKHAHALAEALRRDRPELDARVVSVRGGLYGVEVLAAPVEAEVARPAPAAPRPSPAPEAPRPAPEAPAPRELSDADKALVRRVRQYAAHWEEKAGTFKETDLGIFEERGPARPGGTFKQINERAARRKVALATRLAEALEQGRATEEQKAQIDKLFRSLPTSVRGKLKPTRKPKAAPPPAETPPAPAPIRTEAPPGRPLPQRELLGAETPFALVGQEGRAEVQPGAKPTFEQAFDRLWRERGVSPQEAAERAEVESGQKRPADFDAEAEVKNRRFRALSEAGQAEMFGPEAPKPRAEQERKPAAPAGEPAARQVESAREVSDAPLERAAGSSAKQTEVDVSTLGFYEGFQNREDLMETGRRGVAPPEWIESARGARFVRPDRIQSYLRDREGFDRASIERDPIMFWTDALGEIGPKGARYTISHHRAVLAQSTWEKRGETYWATGTTRRVLPATEVFGTLAQVREIARDVNRATAPNTYAENARRAREIAGDRDDQAAMRKIADRLRVSGVEARRLLNFSHLDRELQPHFGGDADMIPFGHTLGAAVRQFPEYYTAETQRKYLSEITAGEINTGAQLQASLDVTNGILLKLRQQELLGELGASIPPPAVIGRAAGRVFRFMEKEGRLMAGILRDLKKVYGKDQARWPDKVNPVLLDVKERSARVLALKRDYGPDQISTRIVEALRSGQPIEKSIAALKAEIDAKLPPLSEADVPLPPGRSPPILGSFPGNVGQMLYEWVLGGIKRAQTKNARMAGKRASEVRSVDRTGNVRARDQVVYEYDHLSEHAAARVEAIMGMGKAVLPPRLLRAEMDRMQREAFLVEHATALRDDMVGADALVYSAAYYPGARQFSRALEDRPNTMPPKFRAAVEQMREVYDELHALATAELAEIGEKPPGYLKGYVPHVTLGDAPRSLQEAFKVILGDRYTEVEGKKLVNRFFEHREGDPVYLEDATLQFEAYARRLARTVAGNRFLKEVREYLQSDEARQEPWRVQLVRDWVVSTMFREKGTVEMRADDGLRRLFFQKLSGGTSEITRELAASYAGLAPEALKDYTRFFYALRGVRFRFTDPSHWTLLGRDRFGGEVWGGRTADGSRPGTMLGMDVPELRPIFQAIADRFIEARARVRERITTKRPGFEEDVRSRLKFNDGLRRFERNPLQVTTSALSRGLLRALMGWNTRAAFVNSANNLLTSYPEYGLMPVVHGVGREARATIRAARRGTIKLLGERGYLTPREVKAATAALEILPDEVRAEAIGSLQGEVLRARGRLERADANAGVMRHAYEALRPLRPYQAIEDVTRGADAVAATIVGQRMGLRPEEIARVIGATRQAREAAWKAISNDLTDPRSTAHFAAVKSLTTMFAYNALGQPSFFRGPIGSFLGRLTTFPINYFFNYEVRPLVGAATGAAALGRGALRAVTGGRVGVKAPGMKARPPTAPQSFLRRGRLPGPRTAFERFLERGGAGFSSRQAMAVAFRQVAMTGFLLGLSEITGMNWTVLGIPGYHLAMLWMLRTLFPDDERFLRWLQMGTRGAVITYTRGAIGFVGPVSSLLVESGGKLERALRAGGARAEREPELGGKVRELGRGAIEGANASLLEAIRQEAIPGLVQIRRMMQQNPAVVDAMAPWAWNAMNIRSKLPGLTLGEKVQHSLGLLAPERESEVREPTQERARRPAFVGAGR